MAALPPLAAVRVFEAAARLENFSRAAEELAMTQAGVSYQIRLLEERLGARLFMRRGRGIALTPLGRKLSPRVSGAFDELRKAFAMVGSENENVLAITTHQTFATNWLAARLGAFQLQRPSLAVRLDVGDRIVDLDSSEYDVAIRGVSGRPQGVISHFLWRQVVAVMASPAFLARHPIASLADLVVAPRISPGDQWWDLWLDSAGAEPAERPPHPSYFDSQVLDGQAALAGHGLAVLNPLMFSHALSSGQLVCVHPHVVHDHRGIWLCYPEHKRNLAKVRAFRDWLVNEARAFIGDDIYGVLEPTA